MGLFSDQKTSKKEESQPERPASAGASGGAPVGRVMGGGGKKQQPPPAAAAAYGRPQGPDDYVKYVQKNISGVSVVAVRGLVNKHLQTDPTMSMATMLKKIRLQLKQL